MLCKCLNVKIQSPIIPKNDDVITVFVAKMYSAAPWQLLLVAASMRILSGRQLWMNWLKTKWQCSYLETWTAESSRHFDGTMFLSTLALGGILLRHFCESEIVSGASINTVESRDCIGKQQKGCFGGICLLKQAKKQERDAILHICPSQSPRRNRLEHHWPFSK